MRRIFFYKEFLHFFSCFILLMAQQALADDKALGAIDQPALAFETQADYYDDHRGGAHRPGRPGYGRPGHDREIETRTAQINRLVENETLPLRAILGLDRDDRGEEVLRVDVGISRIGRRYGPLRLELLVNENPVNGVWVQSPGLYTLELPRGMRLGFEIRTLKLSVHGRAVVDYVSAHTRTAGGRPNHPGRPGQQLINVPGAVHINGQNYVDLTYYVNDYLRQGYRVDLVRFHGSSQGRFLGEVTLVFDNSAVSQTVVLPRFGGQFELRTDNFGRTPQYVNRLELFVKGGPAVLQNVQILLSR